MPCAALAVPRAAPPRRRPVNPFRQRPVLTVPLEDLHGPAEGTVALPLEMCWSLADPTFSLAEDADRTYLYRTVLQVARDQSQIIPYLNGALLEQMWPQLRADLPRLAPAWEARCPALREAKAA